VLQLIAEGHTSPSIATRLDLAASTIEVHRRNIMRKLNIHNAAELTKYAVRHGITPGISSAAQVNRPEHRSGFSK
jgi:two-component system NarL family response regulator